MNFSIRSALAALILLLLYIPHAKAADWLPVSDEEKNLKTNPIDAGAGAVVLFKHGDVNVQYYHDQFWTVTYVTYTRIKILNEAGREYGNVSVESSNDLRLNSVEGRTILPSGEVIPLDSSKVFRGQVLEKGRSMAVLKTSFTFPSVEPGAIIEYQIQESEDTVFPDPWIFDTRALATLHSTLKFTVDPKIVMHVYGQEPTPNKITGGVSRVATGNQYDLAVQNLRPILDEPFGPPYRDQATMLMISPFETSGGSVLIPIVATWDNVAEDYSNGVENMDKVDVETAKKAKELTDKLPQGRARAEAIYNYIQQNITPSYVSAYTLSRNVDAVLAAKQGDPYEINALYLIMLKHAKVDANLVLLGGRDFQTVVKAFPNVNQFSRVVTRINLKEGEIFADPAVTGAAFGELPWYEKGQTAMVARGNKMQQEDISAGTPDDNASMTKVSFQLDPDWQAKGDVQVEIKGAEAVSLREDLARLSPTKVDEFLAGYLSYGQPEGTTSDVSHPDFHDPSQPLVLKAQLQEKLVNQAGPGQLLLNPWLSDDYNSPVFKVAERHSGIRFDAPEQRVSTTVWQLPLAIKVQQLPKDVKFDSDMGTFSHSCTQNASTLTCTRTFILKKTDFPGIVDYVNVKRFFDEIAKDDQEVVVLQGQ